MLSMVQHGTAPYVHRHGMVECVQSSNKILCTHILSHVQVHVTKLPKTYQIVYMYVCLGFNEFGWLSLRDT